LVHDSLEPESGGADVGQLQARDRVHLG